jgi:hypothetical protein
VRTADNLATFMYRLCGTPESLKLLEPYGPVQARTRIALPVAAAVGAVVVVMFNTLQLNVLRK